MYARNRRGGGGQCRICLIIHNNAIICHSSLLPIPRLSSFEFTEFIRRKILWPEITTWRNGQWFWPVSGVFCHILRLSGWRRCCYIYNNIVMQVCHGDMDYNEKGFQSVVDLEMFFDLSDQVFAPKDSQWYLKRFQNLNKSWNHLILIPNHKLTNKQMLW